MLCCWISIIAFSGTVPALLWGSCCFLHSVAAWRNLSPTGPAKTPHSAGTWHWGSWVALGPVQWMRALQTQVLLRFSASPLPCLEHSLLPGWSAIWIIKQAPMNYILKCKMSCIYTHVHVQQLTHLGLMTDLSTWNLHKWWDWHFFAVRLTHQVVRFP